MVARRSPAMITPPLKVAATMVVAWTEPATGCGMVMGRAVQLRQVTG